MDDFASVDTRSERVLHHLFFKYLWQARFTMVAIDRRKPDAGEIKELRARLAQYIEESGNGEISISILQLPRCVHVLFLSSFL